MDNPNVGVAGRNDGAPFHSQYRPIYEDLQWSITPPGDRERASFLATPVRVARSYCASSADGP